MNRAYKTKKIQYTSSVIKTITGISILCLLTACTSNSEQESAMTQVSESAPKSETNPEPIKPTFDTAEDVEITLVDRLDGTTSSYCIDIMGGGNNIKVEEGLQAHTCYSYKGALGEDQVFSTAKFSENQLYLPNFDVCASVTKPLVGAHIDLASCDGSVAQQFVFANNGTITPTSNPELCITASGETTYGRSQTHQKKVLTLETCSAEMSSKQVWRTRSSED